MMRQYRDLKRRYPDHVLLFRLGDFYETFFEDAELAARLLQITLTARQGAPMAGIPHHASDGYIARLVHAGQKIAVCEQLEAPGREKKLLRRDVVRIITPGTLTDTAYLAGAANKFLLASSAGRDSIGVALVDGSTGEFWAGEDTGKGTEILATALLRRPAEILLPDTARADPVFLARLQATGAALTFCDPATFAPRRASADLCAHFRVDSLAAFGVGDLTAGLGAAAAALAYLRATQGDALGHLTRLARLTAADAMVLDETAVVTLELLTSSGGSVRESLFGVLDETVTPMGARLLRQWLLRPLLDSAAIAARQDAVGALVEAREGRAWIAGLEERERARTGISSLRVRFNRVFGYGIEVTHAQASRVPAEYVRRQTLTGAERYVTPELKEYEAKALGADERRRRLEYELFEDVRRRVAARTDELLATARALARLDVFASLAEVAHVRRHVRPLVDHGDALAIVEGRHSVLEARAGHPVTPNDLALDRDARIVILTGPNMSGKSVYLRQTAPLAIMAQMGAFVPAREARIGVLDRVFTRVGPQDNLARGQSTFLVEMVETATILNNVTSRSLVLLDEVGRGTSTFDGLAIAWAVVEALHEGGHGARVLFATHFHELTRLAGRLGAVRNFHVAVREWNDEIIFLHKVLPGATDWSYGIQVARLAGLRPEVIARAKALLTELEEAGQVRADARDAVQLGLFAPATPPAPMLTELASLDLTHLTPIEALNLLAKWQPGRQHERQASEQQDRHHQATSHPEQHRQAPSQQDWPRETKFQEDPQNPAESRQDRHHQAEAQQDRSQQAPTSGHPRPDPTSRPPLQ